MRSTNPQQAPTRSRIDRLADRAPPAWQNKAQAGALAIDKIATLLGPRVRKHPVQYAVAAVAIAALVGSVVLRRSRAA